MSIADFIDDFQLELRIRDIDGVWVPNTVTGKDAELVGRDHVVGRDYHRGAAGWRRPVAFLILDGRTLTNAGTAT